MRGVGRLILVGALGLTACTSDSKPAASGSSASNATTAAPGTATLTLGGDAGLAGPIVTPQVNCFFPTVDGLQIAVLASSPDGSAIYRIGVASDSVTVKLDTGSGADFNERGFRGAGVSRFDATKGATVDASLTEDGNPGSLTSIK